MRRVVFNREVLDSGNQLVGQAQVGGFLIAKMSIATKFRNLQAHQYARWRWILNISHVRVPGRLFIAQPSYGLPINLYIRNYGHITILDFLLFFLRYLSIRDLFQRAKPVTKSLELAIIQRLASDSEDSKFQPRLIQNLKFTIANSTQINVHGLGNKRLSYLLNSHLKPLTYLHSVPSLPASL